MEAVPKEIQEARDRLKSRMGSVVLMHLFYLQAHNVGKGLGRRGKKAVHKGNQEESKFKVTLKNLGCQPIDGIVEANFFPTDGDLYHFEKPQGILYEMLGNHQFKLAL